MQTFLPHRSFTKSAKCLDNKRLGNQRREAKTLLAALAVGNGWSKHPAAKMWRGHEGSLTEYGIAICKEWIRRGFNDATLPHFKAEGKKLPRKSFSPPWWVGKKKFHSSHRSNLLRKDAKWYGQWGWEEDDSLPYFWPSKKIPPKDKAEKKRKGRSISERFKEFHSNNPWVYKKLIKLINPLYEQHRQRFGLRMLYEVLRWQIATGTIKVDDSFKLNDNYISRYVRLIIKRHPEFGGMFETRTLRAA